MYLLFGEDWEDNLYCWSISFFFMAAALVMVDIGSNYVDRSLKVISKAREEEIEAALLKKKK